jgi:vancomycin resistance protein YoaR
MKNRGINDINEFKSRMKKLYEYKIHDLNLNQEEKVYRISEDEAELNQPKENKPAQPVQSAPEPTPAPQPVQSAPEPTPAPEPVQQAPEPTPAPEPVQSAPEPTPAPISTPVENKPSEDMSMMSFLKTEMQKLDNVVSALENISLNVDQVSKRLDSLTKLVDEIREPSDIEKLEMRAFDSYPYNKTLEKVWGDKMKSKEEQDMERMGIQKTDNGFEMEYTPQRNFNHTQTSNNFNNF